MILSGMDMKMRAPATTIATPLPHSVNRRDYRESSSLPAPTPPSHLTLHRPVLPPSPTRLHHWPSIQKSPLPLPLPPPSTSNTSECGHSFVMIINPATPTTPLPMTAISTTTAPIQHLPQPDDCHLHQYRRYCDCYLCEYYHYHCQAALSMCFLTQNHQTPLVCRTHDSRAA